MSDTSVDRGPLVVASNRGPVTFELGVDSSLSWSRGSGGLVTALTGALEDAHGEWVAATMSEGDVEAERRAGNRPIDLGPDGLDLRMRFLEVPPEIYDGYYNGIANGVLWFAFHYLWDTVRSPTFVEETFDAWDDYVRVNQMFADALAEDTTEDTTYLIQDYHLALVPRMLREHRPDALIAHFSHTPFAGASYIRILPNRIRDELLHGMLGADVLGFQGHDWAENFLNAARLLPSARVDLTRSRIRVEGREVLVRAHPVSVDAAALRQTAGTPEIRQRRAELAGWRGDAKLLLRVDRLELSKNIPRGFIAFERMLEREPSWRGRVKFLAMLSPSRQELPEYRTYGDECREEAERINRKYATKTWTPIEVRIREDYEGALAAYAEYDALLVNPVFDGMNLVAMEGPLLNRRHGVLALSRNAGAFHRLGRYAVPLNPFDIEETAAAIHEALTMPEHERARRARGLSRLVLANPPHRWVSDQLADLERVRRRRVARAAAV
ncbi:MAG: trehalose-6-phosphate synthase [Actinomycetota bacterium]